MIRAVLASLLAFVLSAPAAFADDVPKNWQLGFRPAATPVRERIDSLHNELLIIITLITLFVLGLLLFVIWRFSAKRNPVPSTRTHNSVLEVLWTGVPVVILLVIAIPSFKLMYYMDRAPHADMTLKVTGHQWNWTYTYPDQSNISFLSVGLSDDDAAKAGKPRLLAVDNPVVVPINTTIRILVTGTDVLHSWYMPALGVQEYAVIGRVNEAWMLIDKPGVYYGECNQICGNNHPFMPIEVHAVSKEDFAKWVEDAKKKFAHDEAPAPVRVASGVAQ